MEIKKPVHAIALFSGGLDSSLAILLMLSQGIEVTALTFANHFGCDIEDRSGCGHNPHPTAEKFGFRVKLVHLGERFVDIVQNPKYGYGKNMNPCIDCRILMLREAREYMNMVGADFIITGEVLGQRPKSQMRNTLNQIIKEAGLQGYLLRPLSAKLLPPTIAEEQGLVDRDRLERISGRSRKRQLELAEQFGLEHYSSPTAGCLLTDRGYSTKLRDLLEHQGQLTIDDINLLRIGRHFRISPTLRIIIGRNQTDNNKLERYADKYPVLEVMDHGSPLALLIGDHDDDALKIAAALTARYSDGKRLDLVKVNFLMDGVHRQFSVAPLKPQQVEPYRMVWKPRPEAPRL